MPTQKLESKVAVGVLTIPAKDVWDDSLQLVQDLAGTWYKLSKNLVAIYDNEIWRGKGFQSFRDSIEIGLGLDYKKTTCRIQQGRAIIKYNITEEQVRNMKESNFKELATVMTMDLDPSEVDELIALGLNSTFREVQEMVKKLKATKVGGQIVEMMHVTISVTRDTWDVIEVALNEVAEFIGSDSTIGTRIAYALQEWTLHHNPDLVPVIKERLGLTKPVETEVKIPQKERIDKGKKKVKKG